MIPNNITLGPLTIHLYGLMIGIGLLAAVNVAERVLKREKINIQNVSGMIIGVLLAGIIGARAYHVVDYWNYYSSNLIEIIYVWNGGLGIYGAIIGGGAALYYLARKSKVSWIFLIDAASIALPLGQAIGRWGNYFNQELYGLPTNLIWAIFIPMNKRLVGFEDFSYYHPLFLYESIGSILLFGLMYFLWCKKLLSLGTGNYVALYALGYGLLRFSLEFMRIESWAIMGVRVAQMISVVMVVLGGGRLWFSRSKDGY